MRTGNFDFKREMNTYGWESKFYLVENCLKRRGWKASPKKEKDDDGVVEYEEGDEDGGERVLQSRERRQRDRVQIGSGKDVDVGGF